MSNHTDNMQLEEISLEDIPEATRGTSRKNTGKYFTILANFDESGVEAALVHFEGEVKTNTVTAYLRKLAARENFDVNVISRQGQVYLVRN